MKKELKTEKTKEKIRSAALEEFGKNGYEGATVNRICSDNHISKGLIYHNFENKDALYLHCVDYTIRSFVGYMSEHGVTDDLHQYISVRFRFFSENPYLSRIFFEAALQPPDHLADAIKPLRQELDEYNTNVYLAALKKMKLRPGVTEKEAIEYYNILQGTFNRYFGSPAYQGAPFSDIISEHEAKLGRILDFMLYGIAKEDENQ